MNFFEPITNATCTLPPRQPVVAANQAGGRRAPRKTYKAKHRGTKTRKYRAATQHHRRR